MSTKRILNILLIGCTIVASAGLCSAQDTAVQSDDRMQWWREARFGMFIHWGLYSVLGGEWNGKDHGKEMGKADAAWIMLMAPVPTDEYKKLAQQFNPVKFDAKAWVSLAKEAGMRYMVITSKHHDGFCLFDTKHTDYDIMDATPFKRDIIKELSEECRRQGIRFGVYYSQRQDWYHRGRTSKERPPDNYVRMAKGHVRELLTNYGDIGVIWFDTGGAFLDLNESYGQLVRNLQSRSIICSRLYSRMVKKEDRKYADYESLRDRTIASRRVQGDVEACMPMRHNWGYDRDDNSWKSTKDIIERLVLSACRGTNFLLNVGPTPEGVMCPEEIERLKAIGEWMKANGESIYGTTASPLDFDFEWGAISRKPGKLYLHVMKWNPEGIIFNGLASKPSKAYLLADPERKMLTVERDAKKNLTTVRVPHEAPDPNDSVIVLEFDSPVRIDETAKGRYHWAKGTGLKRRNKTKKK
jgi:alpha-L-fucosidase